MDAHALYDEALRSYRAYLVIAGSQPADVISLKWPDVAKAAIDGNVELLCRDLRWMIYEPLRIVYNSLLERVTQETGKTLPRFEMAIDAPPSSGSELVAARNKLIDRTDELLGLLQTLTGKRYTKISEVLDASDGNHQRLRQR